MQAGQRHDDGASQIVEKQENHGHGEEGAENEARIDIGKGITNRYRIVLERNPVQVSGQVVLQLIECTVYLIYHRDGVCI